MKPLYAILFTFCLIALLPAAYAQNVKVINLPTNDLIYDSYTAKLYASIPSSASGTGDTITVIDPVTGVVVSSVPIGSSPSKLAASDDGQSIYVSLDGSHSVRRFDTFSQTAGLEFPLVKDSSGYAYVRDMQVLPGISASVAISGGPGVFIYDNGVPRPNADNGYYSIAFSSTAARLYAYDGNDTSYGFARLNVDSSGVSVQDTANDLTSANVGKIKFAGGLIYVSNGAVIDPEARQLQGAFAASGSLAPDIARHRVYILNELDSNFSGILERDAEIQVFDSQTYRCLGALTIPIAAPVFLGDTPSSLVRWGENGLAFRSGNQVYLVDSTAFPALAGLTLSASSVSGGAALTGTITLTQPAPPSGAVITLSKSSPISVFTPFFVRIPAGAKRLTFPITTTAVPLTVGVVLTAQYGTQSAVTLTVRDAAGDSAFSSASRVLMQPANDLVYDPNTEKIYVSVPSSAGARGNSITAIDPTTGRVEGSAYIGSEPDILALSDDGQFLYAGLDGAGAIGRLEMATQTADLQFSLGRDNDAGTLYPRDLAVLPGNPHALAVSRHYADISPDAAGVAVFDDAVQRPKTSDYEVSSIVFGPSADLLYGGALSEMPIDASGISDRSQYAHLLGGDIAYDSGLLYGASGQVVDPVSQTLKGSFPTFSSSFGDNYPESIVTDVAHGRVYLLVGDNFGTATTAQVFAFNARTYRPVESLLVNGISGTVSSLIRWGDSGLAFRTSGGQIFLFDHPEFPALESLRLSSASVSGGKSLTGTVTLTRPAPVGGYVVSLTQTNYAPAVFPGVVTVPAGAIRANFPITTPAVSANTGLMISATDGVETRQAPLTILDAAGDAPYPPTIQVLTLPANDLIYDPTTAQIYASVPGSAGQQGNSVTAIDPLHVKIGRSIFVGSEPDKLARTDDGKYLYVGLDGAAGIRRFDLASQKPGLQFSVGGDPGFFGLYHAADIQTLPGQSDSVAVSLLDHNDNPYANLAIFDSGVPRPQSLTPNYDQYYSLAFSDSASRLYALDNYGSGLARIDVNATGVTFLDTTSLPQSGAIKFDNGLIYTNSGEAFDPIAEVVKGIFSGVGVYGPLIETDVKINNRVYFLTGSDGGIYSTLTLQAFDATTYQLVGTLMIPGVIGYPSSLIRWGADGLAFRTSGNQVFLIRTALVPSSLPVPTHLYLSPFPLPAGATTIAGIVLTAAAPVGGVTVWLSYSDPGAVDLPSTVTVPAGQKSAAFLISTRLARSDSALTVYASAGGVTQSGVLSVTGLPVPARH